MSLLINWFEIPAENFERAIDFYESVFDLELSVFSYEKEQMGFFPSGGGLSGAISKSPGFLPGKDGVLISFRCGGDLDDTLVKISASGGIVMKEKTKIEAEGRGYFALFLDSEGNRISLYSDQ